VDQGNHDPPWWTRSVQDHLGPRSDLSLMIDSDTPLPDAPRNTPPAHTVRFIILDRLTDAKTPSAPRAATPRPSPAAAPPPLPTLPTLVTTTMPSPGNAGLAQSRLLSPRPPHLPTKHYLMPPLTMTKPWMWATMASQHPLLPQPPQPRPLTFPSPDPSNKPETLPPPAASNTFQTYGFVPEMIDKPYSTSCHGLAPATNLTLVQHNSLGCWDVFLSLFSIPSGRPPR